MLHLYKRIVLLFKAYAGRSHMSREHVGIIRQQEQFLAYGIHDLLVGSSREISSSDGLAEEGIPAKKSLVLLSRRYTCHLPYGLVCG